MLSAQYLLTPSLDQYQTWCRSCPHWVDDHYWFSHGQRSRSNHSLAHCVVVRPISFDPFTWSIPSLVQGLCPIIRWSILMFRSHVQRSRSKHSFEPSVLSTLYFNPLLTCFGQVLLLKRSCTMGGIYVSEIFLVFFQGSSYTPLILNLDILTKLYIYYWNSLSAQLLWNCWIEFCKTYICKKKKLLQDA